LHINKYFLLYCVFFLTLTFTFLQGQIFFQTNQNLFSGVASGRIFAPVECGVCRFRALAFHRNGRTAKFVVIRKSSIVGILALFGLNARTQSLKKIKSPYRYIYEENIKYYEITPLIFLFGNIYLYRYVDFTVPV
jgi:hypothetical protein